MSYIIINGIPINVWPTPKSSHLRDMTEVEDVEYIELETKINNNEETERDH